MEIEGGMLALVRFGFWSAERWGDSSVWPSSFSGGLSAHSQVGCATVRQECRRYGCGRGTCRCRLWLGTRGGSPVLGQERVGRGVRVDLWWAVGWVSARSQEWMRDAGRSAGATGQSENLRERQFESGATSHSKAGRWMAIRAWRGNFSPTRARRWLLRTSNLRWPAWRFVGCEFTRRGKRCGVAPRFGEARIQCLP